MGKLSRIRRLLLGRMTPFSFLSTVRRRIIAGFGLLVTSKRRQLENEREQALAQLRESEERWRSLVENAPGFITTMDLDGTIITANRALPGLTPEDLVGKSIFILIPPEYHEESRKRFQRILATGETESSEIIGPGPDGGPSWYISRIGPLKENGDVTGFVSVATDITELRRAEEALRESEERLRTVVNGAPVVLFAVDRHGVLTLSEGKGLEALGRKPGEVVGRSVFEVYRDVPKIGENIRRALAGEAFTSGVEVDDLVFETRYSPVPGQDGEIVGIIGVATDITERHRAEALFHSLAEGAPIGIFVVHDGRFRFVNPEFQRHTSFSAEELLGRDALSLALPEDRESVRANAVAMLKGERSEPYEYRVVTKGGEIRWIMEQVASIRYQGRRAALGYYMDITERRQMLDALMESEKKYRLIVDNTSDIIYQADPAQGTVHFISGQVADVLGYQPEELMRDPKAWGEMVNPDDMPGLAESIRQMVATRQPVVRQYRLRHRATGEYVWFEDKIVPRFDEAGKLVGVQGVMRDVTERKRAEQALAELNRSLEEKVRQRTEALRQANEELQERHRQLLTARAQAASDALTGLWNHRAFHERIREEVSLAQANSGDSIGLIMLDIDGFKQINDSLGHLEGDQILRQLAALLTGVARQKDAYRYGGDEFALLLPGADGRTTARLAERLRRAIERRMNGNGNKVTVSLGTASFPDVARSAEELIYKADAAMYSAKSAGKNRVGTWEKPFAHREGKAATQNLDKQLRYVPDVAAALVAALAAKDPVTSAHAERCSWYAPRLADELGLTKREKAIVRVSALLHDIGKLAIPDEVLFKPGPLDEEEWAQMKQHPVAAIRILSQIVIIAEAAPAILHHHEHFDGSGYPDSLAGDAIPVASRILLVSDAFDAMTTDRPYRKAMPVEAAIEELKRYSGKQFDPEVVDAFIRVLSRYGTEWRPPSKKSWCPRQSGSQRAAPGSSRRPPQAPSGHPRD